MRDGLWPIVGVLLGIGIILVASAGTGVTSSHSWSTWLFLRKHLVFVLLGLSIGFVVSRTNIPVDRIALCIGVAGVILALLVGKPIKGSYRWINIAGLSFQPSEFLKLGTVLTLSRRQDLFAGCVFALSCALLLLQPDFGSLMLLSVVALIILFASGVRLKYFAIAMTLCCSAGVAGYLTLGHVRARVHAFRAQDQYGKSYQLNKALDSFRSGGLIGKGPGGGKLKVYLPDAHTDFIFAVAGEELGLLGCVSIIGLFLCILLYVFAHSANMLVIGAGSMILLQAWLHMCSNLGLIPTKGFTLPIVGYGGSGFIATMCCIGVLIRSSKRYDYVLDKYKLKRSA